MSQRFSGYERKERDCYETPEWVTRSLIPHLPRKPAGIWEPACGSGKMVQALLSAKLNITIRFTDIDSGTDFLAETSPYGTDAIITNPPYGLADKFICAALYLMQPPVSGQVAMLLRTDYDHAKSRQYIFRDPTFAKKVVLTKRIVWFERPGAAPSFNHAWFIWDWKHRGPPTLAYGP